MIQDIAAHRPLAPPVATHRVIWFLTGLGLAVADATIAAIGLGVARAIWHW